MGLKNLIGRYLISHEEYRFRKKRAGALKTIVLGIVLILIGFYFLFSSDFKVALTLFLVGAMLIIIGLFVRKYAYIMN